MTKEIELSNGEFVKVDEEDYNYLSSFRWHKTSNSYAMRKGDPGRPKVLMHREIMKADKRVLIDHINGNTLDNRKANLRLCNPTENVQNSRKLKVLSSKYKGVHWCSTKETWISRIHPEQRNITLGYFREEKSAAYLYDFFALKMYGEFANINGISLDEIQDEMDIKKIKDMTTGTTKDVGLKKTSTGWQAFVSFNSKKIQIGFYGTKREAFDAYNQYIIDNKLNKKLNRWEG